MGELKVAIDHYKRSLSVSRELGDLSSEGHACYSIGNSYTLLREYSSAMQYQLRHLEIANRMRNKVTAVVEK